MNDGVRFNRRSTRNVQLQGKPSYSETRKRKQARPQHYEEFEELVEPSSSTDDQFSSLQVDEMGTEREFSKRRKLIAQVEEELREQQPASSVKLSQIELQKRRLRSQHDDFDSRKQNPGSVEPCSSTDQLSSSFNSDELSDNYNYNLDFWSVDDVDVDGMVNGIVNNDTFLGTTQTVSDEDSSHERVLHTPTAEMSLNSPDVEEDGRPHTPTIRPATPDFNSSPLTPSVLVSSSLDTSSLVGESSVAGYGSPSTPLCPPRVGLLSPTSLIELPLSSATTSPTSAAPPLNILESDESDLNDDNHNHNSSNSHHDTSTPTTTTTHTRTPSPDISLGIQSFNPPTYSTLSKHSQRLRIKAPISRPKVPKAGSSSPTRSQTPSHTVKKSSNKINKSCSSSSSSGPNTSCSSSKLSSLMAKGTQPATGSPKLVKKTGTTIFGKNSCSSDGAVNNVKFTQRFTSPNPRKQVTFTKLQTKMTQSQECPSTSSSALITSTSSPHYPSPEYPTPNSPPKRIQIPEPSFSQPVSVAEKPHSCIKKSVNDQSATQIPEANATTSAESPRNRYVRDGNLISTKMINFMAHKEKVACWNPNVHIIVGSNGSGKSACINALLLVFGARASNTQRASSVKSLIKRGQMCGEIEVHLTNYYGTLDKRRYGEEIIISRKIKYSGSSVYMISAPDKRKRKLTQIELSYITHALQIDPNNPTQFLKQERPGESGKQGTGSDCNHTRFKKFLASTQLTTKKYMVDQARDNLEAAKVLIKTKEEMQRFVTFQTAKLQKQCNVIKKMEESKDLLRDLQNERVWSEVRVREDEQNKIKISKQEIYSQMKGQEQEKSQFEDELNNFKSMEKNNKDEIRKLQEELNIKLHEKEGKREDFRNATNMHQRAKSDHDCNLKLIQKYTREIAELEGRLNEDKKSLEEQNQQYQREIEECEAQIALKKGALPNWERRDKILSEIDEFKARERKDLKDIEKLQIQLKQTERELNKKEDNFGQQMQALLNRINRTTWTDRPLGPLGAYIEVPDSKYAPLIEQIIYKCLHTFFVQTKEDFDKLMKLIREVYKDGRGNHKKYGKQPSVTLMRNLNMKEYKRRLDCMNRLLSTSSFRSVLSMLSISDPLAQVGIVESTSCERIVLFDSNQSATNVMKYKEKVPKEILAAYTLEWYKVVARPRLQFQVFKEPRGKTDIIPMAGVEAAAHINQEISRKREVLNTCRMSTKLLHESLRRHDKEVQDVNKEINQLKNKLNYAENSIRREVPGQNEEDIANDIQMLIEMREKKEKDLQVNAHEMDIAKKNIKRTGDEKDSLAKEIDELMEKRHNWEIQQSNSSGIVAKLQKQIDKISIHKEVLTKQFNQLSLEDTKIDTDLKKKLAVAETNGQRPKNLNRDPKTIQLEIDNLEMYLKHNSDKLKQKVRVFTEFKNSKLLLSQITTELNCIKFLCDRLDPYIKVGEDCYEKMKKVLGQQLKTNYQLLVENHKLTGGIEIDWDAELLIYCVCPDKASEERANRNYKMVNGEMKIVNKQGISDYHGGLSGGEKSKALVFYIMAMWKMTELPFHVLDEFEACLDEISRTSIHATLIEHAKENPDAQFIILTPLQLDSRIPKNDPFITVERLEKLDK